jgi:predicted RNA-binding Zn-ribbon protein involved in translation (DUF1610 family)
VSDQLHSDAHSAVPPVPSAVSTGSLPCAGCGAGLEYSPGDSELLCPYCGVKTPVTGGAEPVAAAVEELDFREWLARAAEAPENLHEVTTARCTGCGAQTTLAENVVADSCPFCASSLVAADASAKLVRPRALLPFKVTRTDAERLLEDWVKGLWFAPNDFKTHARREGGVNGIYVPCWTYDAATTTHYTGQRGEHYYETEAYTETNDKGETETKTRQVQRTAWYSTSGTVRLDFDDLLVMASGSLPPKQAAALQPWDMDALVSFSDEYLRGFRAESYSVPLDQGFEQAKVAMDPEIRGAIERDIGGDKQRIGSMDTRYEDVSFKHVLLPVWIGAWKHRDRVYRRMVNARTGEVQGERPYSPVKIALLVLFILAVLATVFFVYQSNHPHAVSTTTYGWLHETRATFATEDVRQLEVRIAA